jgi:outer membrane protein assembly factor BamB
MKDGESVRLLFERPGYVSKKVPVPDKRVGWLTVALNEKAELWGMPTGFPSTGEPALGEDIFFVADGSRLFAIRLSTQRLLGTEVMETTIVGSPKYSNGRVYVAAGNTVTAFEPLKMGLKQPAWKYDAKESIKGTPGLSPDGLLLFISTTGDMPVIRAIDTRTGMPVWKKPLPAEAIAEPMVAGDVLVVACDDGTILGIKSESAADAWPRIPGNAGYLTSAVSGTYVYLTGVDQSVHAIDAKSGAREWKQALPATPTGKAVRVGNRVCVSGKNGASGKVYFLNAINGAPMDNCPAGGPIMGGVTAAGTLLLFGSDDRNFYCFDTNRGAVLWKWRNEKNDRKLRNPAIVKDGVAYFCGEDTLYAIELN